MVRVLLLSFDFNSSSFNVLQSIFGVQFYKCVYKHKIESKCRTTIDDKYNIYHQIPQIFSYKYTLKNV